MIDVIMRWMRRATWLYIVALFALVVGSLPASAIASLFSTSKCDMACCVDKQPHEAWAKAEVCAESCVNDMGGHSVPKSSLNANKDDACKCSIGSAPSVPTQTPVAAPAPGLTVHTVIADLAPEPLIIVVPIDRPTEAGIYGADSGPPISRPNYVSLGRAPPVLLA